MLQKIIKRVITCFLSFAIVFSLFYFAMNINVYADDGSGQMVTISGAFYLPNGVKAGAGGLSVYICAESVDQNLSTSITIPEGANSQSYSISVPKDAVSSVWLIHYSIIGADKHYLTTGYYGGDKSVSSEEKAILVDIDTDTDLSNINLYTISAYCILGKINMPSGETASDNIDVKVSAVSSEYTSSSYITILGGQSSASYNLCIPSEYADLNWQVKYDIQNNPTDEDYVKSACGDTFSGISQDINNIDMDLISDKADNVITLSIDNSDHDINDLGKYGISIYKKCYDENNNIFYSEVQYDTDMSLMEEQNDYLVKIRNLDWSNDAEYYTCIQVDNKLFEIKLDSYMQGQTIPVSKDVVPVTIDIPFKQTNFKINSISLFPLNQNVSIGLNYFYNPGDTIYIPSGTYGFQINASDDNNNYILTKPSCELSSVNNTVSFAQDDLTKLNININDPNNYKWQLYNLVPYYFNSTICENISADKSLIVSSVPYDEIGIELCSRKGWRYQFNVSNPDLSSASIKSLSLDNNFNENLTFNKSSYPAGTKLGESDFSFDIKDGNNNKLGYIYDAIFYDSAKLNIKFYNDKITYEPNSNDITFPDSINPKLPSTPGSYNVSFDLLGLENHKLEKALSANSQILITEGSAVNNIPANTVIIGSNAYNARCLFKPQFSSEISKLVNVNSNNMYFKIAGVNASKWTKLEDPFKTVDASELPAVTYNDGNGNIVKYAQGDGEIIP